MDMRCLFAGAEAEAAGRPEGANPSETKPPAGASPDAVIAGESVGSDTWRGVGLRVAMKSKSLRQSRTPFDSSIRHSFCLAKISTTDEL